MFEGVARIEKWAFSSCTNLVRMTIPNSMERIEIGAFSSCNEALFDVTAIPGVELVDGWAYGSTGTLTDLDLTGIRGIIDGAFSGCSALTSVKIPDSVKNIGDDVFSGCTGLMTVTIPNSVTNIGSSAFGGCSGVTNLTIGNSVRSIGGAAFKKCNITEVTIPRSVTDIKASAFAACKRLKSFEVECENSAYKTVSGLLLTKDGSTLVHGVNGNVTIPDGVARIGDYAFHGLSNLTNVTVPASVTSIGTEPFFSSGEVFCDKLSSVIMLGDEPAVDRNYWGIFHSSIYYYNRVDVTVYVTGKWTGSTGSWQYAGVKVVDDAQATVGGNVVTVPTSWFLCYPGIFKPNGNASDVVATTAANGKRSVAECYVLGVDPEDPDDDLKIAGFKMEDGKPVITLNHTKDGSGNSFMPRVKTLGKADIKNTAEEWREVPVYGDSSMRFFKVIVEVP